MVFARLIIDKNDYGVQPFLVQLRDVTTFKHKKGVNTGDLGTKFGYNSKDNGWARFNQVRIPRTDMMMGLTSVEQDGTFSITGDLRVLYTVMMTIRMIIVRDSGIALLIGTTIAIRYNSVRRQFKT